MQRVQKDGFVLWEAWVDQNNKEAAWIRALQERVNALEEVLSINEQGYTVKRSDHLRNLLERIIKAYEQPSTYPELLVDLIQEAKYRIKQEAAERGSDE